MLRHIWLNLLICCFTLRSCQIQLININSHIHMMLRCFASWSLDKRHTVSMWHDTSWLMSVFGNRSRLMWTVAKYLRLFAETYQQILYQKSIDTIRYPYHSLNLARPRKKFNFFIRFYYYSDSNIKVKFDEELPSPPPCLFFVQRTGQQLFFAPTDDSTPMHSTFGKLKILIAMLLLLRVLFQFQHVLIKVRHK